MKDEQQTERIMDWLEGRMSAQESKAMEGEMTSDHDLAQACEDLSALTDALSHMDETVQPSAEFHQNLMTKLRLEEQTIRKQVGQGMDEKSIIAEQNEVQEKKVKTTGGFMGYVRRVPTFMRRHPAASVCAAAAVVLVVIINALGTGVGSPMDMMSSRNSGGAGSYNASVSSGSSASMPSPGAAAPQVMYDGQVSSVYGGLVGNAAKSELFEAESYDMAVEERGMPEVFEGFSRSYDEAQAEAAPGVAAGVEAGRDSAGRQDTGASDSSGAQAAVAQKIIRNGNMSLEVQRFDDAVAALKAVVNSMGGYVTNESSNLIDGGERKAGNIQIKVPFQRYDELMGQAESLGKVLNSSVWSEDVTAQYVDLQARIGVYQTKHERLLALLEQSGELEAVLSIEKELASTSAELESLKGQMRYLLDRTDYSTLDIYLTERRIEAVEVRLTGWAGFSQRVGESFNLGTNALIRSIGNFIVRLAGNLAALLLLAIVCAAVWFFWRNRRRKQRASREGENK